MGEMGGMVGKRTLGRGKGGLQKKRRNFWPEKEEKNESPALLFWGEPDFLTVGARKTLPGPTQVGGSHSPLPPAPPKVLARLESDSEDAV